MGINHITLMGTVARAPEYRMTPSGTPMTTFQVAVTRPPRQEGGHPVTDYVRVVTWRGVAEKTSESIKKGDLVVIEGRLSTRSYETNDGQRRKTVEVDANSVEPVSGATGQALGAEDEPPFEDEFAEFEAPAAAPASAPRAVRPPQRAPEPAADLDDEIPF